VLLYKYTMGNSQSTQDNQLSNTAGLLQMSRLPNEITIPLFMPSPLKKLGNMGMQIGSELGNAGMQIGSELGNVGMQIGSELGSNGVSKTKLAKSVEEQHARQKAQVSTTLNAEKKRSDKAADIRLATEIVSTVGRLSGPNISVNGPDLSGDIPGLDVNGESVSAPADISVSMPGLPSVDIASGMNVPSINVPSINVPSGMNVPSINVPSINVPSGMNVPSINVPPVSVSIKTDGATQLVESAALQKAAAVKAVKQKENELLNTVQQAEAAGTMDTIEVGIAVDRVLQEKEEAAQFAIRKEEELITTIDTVMESGQFTKQSIIETINKINKMMNDDEMNIDIKCLLTKIINGKDELNPPTIASYIEDCVEEKEDVAEGFGHLSQNNQWLVWLILLVLILLLLINFGPSYGIEIL
jgi:hypothetical protein